MLQEAQVFKITLPDGTVLRGPSKEAVLIAARKRTNIPSTSPLQDEISKLSLPKAGAPLPIPDELKVTPRTKILDEVANEQDKRKATFHDRLYTGNRVVTEGLAGATATSLTGSPTLGAAAIATVDKLLRHLEGTDSTQLPISELTGVKHETGNPLIDVPSDIVEGTLTNEALGRIIGPIIGKVGAVISEADANKGGITQKLIAKTRDAVLNSLGKSTSSYGAGTITGDFSRLNPTLSQQLENAKMSGAKVASAVEDLGAPKSKRTAVINSSKIIDKEIDKTLSTISQTPTTLSQLEDVAGSAGVSADYVYKRAGEKATLLSNEVRANANRNIELVQTMTSPATQVPSSMLDASGQPVMQTVPAQYSTKEVAGPIHLDNLVNKAIELKKNIADVLGKPDPNNPLLADIDTILEKVNAQFDDTGKLISYEPIDFNSAWNSKQLYGDKGFGIPREKLTAVDTRYRELYHAINQDMEDSIPKWKNDGAISATQFSHAKEISNLRHNIYNPEGKSGITVSDLLSNSQGVFPNKFSPIIDKIADDLPSLQNFLQTGDLKIPGIQIAKTNARRDMQGYVFGRTINEGKELLNKNTPSRDVGLNKQKIMQTWTNYVNSPEGEKLYGKNTPLKENLTKLLEEFSTVRSQLNEGGSRYIKLRLGSSALTFLPALAFGYEKGIASGGVVLGASIGIHSLAKLMNDPEAARLMFAFIKGQPLNMSTQLAARTIAQALKGELMDVDLENGQRVSGRVNGKGELTPNQGDK